MVIMMDLPNALWVKTETRLRTTFGGVPAAP
jgi:hypothetical protein